MRDQIHIEQLQLSSHIGVPDDEQRAPQRLTATLTLNPLRDFKDLQDDITRAVNYYDVCRRIEVVASARPRRLIETLAEDIAADLLATFPLRRVDVEIRKFILPETAFVAVHLRRERAAT